MALFICLFVLSLAHCFRSLQPQLEGSITLFACDGAGLTLGICSREHYSCHDNQSPNAPI